ncbi:EAL domain-containing protein [Sphingomonas sp. I4]
MGGFDFSGSDLRGARLRFAHTDSTTLLLDAKLDGEDAAWLENQQRSVDPEEEPLLRDLRHALRDGEFSLVFQPIVSLKLGHVQRVEALVRWNRPERGNVAPAVFIPIMEEAGLMHDLTYHVIDEAIQQQRYLDGVNVEVTISVNVSPYSLLHRDFVMNCQRLMHGQKARIRFEVTETVLALDHDLFMRNVGELRKYGVSIAIDNYGVSYSSLAELKIIAADELKIDGSLVRQLNEEGRDPRFIKSIVDLGHAMGMTVTAEGVENETELDLLVAFGCDDAQGYVFGRPLSGEDLARRIEDIPWTGLEAGRGKHGLRGWFS